MKIRQLAFAMLAFTAVSSHASNWPTQPVQIVVPYPPGKVWTLRPHHCAEP